ncbi:MAG: hypothetical protein JXR53_02115 [Bacteroidales bacterium]|nr:hypothetical protein [Bacteroidales bacterium]
MRWLLIFSMILSVTLFSCKCREKQKDINEIQDTEIITGVVQGEHIGVIHHNYEESTCTVIEAVKGDEVFYLIPVNGLPEAMDIDGMLIRFNYHALKMPQPEGCTKGIPVELSDVEAQK